ncbi:MAG: glycosyltransferase family 39 protein [Cytophagales bacterium]
MPISYDEAWTFLNFTQKGIITSLCYYPAPNNHVFFSIITCLSNSIHFIDKTFSLRLPVILSSLATLIITYDFIKRTLNKNVAIVMVTLMSVLFMNIYYSYMARGYSFLFLFFVISCYASFQILKNSSNKYLWLIFTISNVLGFFSIPSFLYPFLTLHVFVLLRLKNVSFLQIYSGGITVILTILVYTPIGVLNGTNALTNNSYVTPISRVLVAQQLPAFFTTTLEELIGFNLGVVLTIIFCSMVYISIFKKEYILFYILFLSAPFILLIIHSVIPFPRTFYYYSFIMSLLVVLPFEKILNKMKDITVFTICFIIQFSFIYNFSIKIKNVESYSLIIDQTISNLKINHKDSIYCNSGLADAYLLYNNLNIEYSNPHYCNLDTLIPKYNNNYYLIDSHLDKTKFAKPLKNNKFFNIYYKETENNLY